MKKDLKEERNEKEKNNRIICSFSDDCKFDHRMWSIRKY